ncbi:MAG: alkaline phosphatase family protein [Candidatus Latescibacterota bacterium]|nr:MAG: alkaline phosphatase family protein [Candidatus Latescibacterota bacterium]
MTGSRNRNPLTIILLVDALGWDVVREFDFCKDLLPHSGPLDTVLGYSSAAIPSLLSGAAPDRHGAWAMYRYAPSQSPFKLFRFVPKLPHALEWRVRAAMRRYMARRETIKGYYDLYEIPLRVLGYLDVAQRGDPYTPGGMSAETIFDRFASANVSYRAWNYKTPELVNFDALREAIETDSRVLFLYTAELDALMHRVGTRHSEVAGKLHYYETQIEALLTAAASAGRDTTVLVFSDHGMTDVEEIVDVAGAVDGWGFRPGADGVAFYDSTMARFWSPSDVRHDLEAKLNATGWGCVLTREELDTLGCRFEDNSYGDTIFLVNPGYLILPSYMSKEPVAAMHGYHPDDRGSRGCFMTNDPDVSLPRSILDIKALVINIVLETR